MANTGISSFYQTATKRGFARTNLFRINAITRNGADDVYKPSSDTDNLFLYAQDGKVPSRVISTTTVDFKSFKYNIPMVASYPEAAGSWDVSFYCDRDYILRNVLEKWSVDTFNEHTSVSQKPNWWDCKIELNLLSNSGNLFQGSNASTEPQVIRKYFLVGAFLQNTGTITYETKSGADIAKLTATIGFQYMTSEDILT